MTPTEARQHLAREEAAYQRVRMNLHDDGLDYWIRRLGDARAQLVLAERAALKAAPEVHRRKPARKRRAA